MTDPLIESELASHLSPGEKLVWTGRPKTGIVFRPMDIFLVPFSLLWCGGVTFAQVSAFRSGAPLFFLFWGLPFILIGLYITIGRFYMDSRRRANTCYGITADRILIKSGIFSKEVKSLNIKVISDITLKEKADGSGTITLGPVDFRYAMMEGMEWPGVKQPPRLEFIEEVKSVYSKIIEFQRR